MRAHGGARRGRNALAMAAIVTVVWVASAPASELEEAIRVRMEGNKSSAKSQEAIDQLSEQTDALVREYRSVLDQTDAVRVYNTQLEKLLAAQEREADSLQKQIDNAGLISRELTPLMLKMIDALDSFVKLDLPFLLDERGKRVVSLRELMERADVTDSEKYRRILEAYQVENDYGRTIEAYQGTLEVGGVSRTVDFLRVGRIALIYQTLDGTEAGVWNTAKQEWQPLGGDYRGSIRQGLRIARKQAAPDLIRLPIQAAEEVR